MAADICSFGAAEKIRQLIGAKWISLITHIGYPLPSMMGLLKRKRVNVLDPHSYLKMCLISTVNSELLGTNSSERDPDLIGA